MRLSGQRGECRPSKAKPPPGINTAATLPVRLPSISDITDLSPSRRLIRWPGCVLHPITPAPPWRASGFSPRQHELPFNYGRQPFNLQVAALRGGNASAGSTLMPIPASTMGKSVAGWPISCTISASIAKWASAASISGRLPEA